MIVKKVKNPKKSASKAARVKGLVDYIRSPERDNANEKCIHVGARGFLTESAAGQRAEMLALAQETVRSKDPISHYVLSWQESERPTVAQVEEAVDIFLGEMGLTDHQVIYGLHADTDNIHLHIVVNRVHPRTLKVIKPNKGFDIEAAHRSIARIEQEQGWKPERNARYQVLGNGDVARAVSDPAKARQPDQPKRDMEQRTGEKSAERIAIEDGAPLIQRATSWAELHRELAAKGMRYERIGSGAVIFVAGGIGGVGGAEVGVKASGAHREASFSKLQKRLGVYEPAPANHRVALRKPEPLHEGLPRWDDYIAKRKAHYAAKDDAVQEQSRHEDGERRRLAGRQKTERAAALKGSFKGLVELRNALQVAVASEQAREKKELTARQRQQRLRLRDQFQPYPDLEPWLRQRQASEQAEDWRHRASAPQRLEGASYELPVPRALRDFVAEVHGREVHYFRRLRESPQRIDQASRPTPDAARPHDGSEAKAKARIEADAASVDHAEVASFVDRGKVIDIYDWRNRETTLAALELSRQKWGRFEVRGNEEYKALCVALAAEHGFEVVNPELQERIQVERRRLREDAQQRAQVEEARASKAEALRAFEAYHLAVGAERYRLSSVRREPGGRRRTLLVDEDGGEVGWEVAEVRRRLVDRPRLPGGGEHLHVTPLSDRKHHVLIAGLDLERLEGLMRDSYRPAAVLEIQPGSYQAILTVAKLGRANDQIVGALLAEQLNREYGDPMLSGGGHPHAVPGYALGDERWALGQAAGGGTFVVSLHLAERRECMTALGLSSQIGRRLEQEREQEREAAAAGDLAIQGRKLPSLVPAGATSDAVDAYRRHYRDVLERQEGGKVDLSRVDSMIAVRLRVTGHLQDDIAAALRQCAPGIRAPEEVRDWGDYAQRTARYAFSSTGERQARELDKYRERWVQLEGRATASKPARPMGTDQSERNRIARQTERHERENSRKGPEMGL